MTQNFIFIENIKVVVEDQRKGNVDVQNEHLQDCGDKDGVQTPSSFRNHVFDNNCKFFFVSLNLFFITIFSSFLVCV